MLDGLMGWSRSAVLVVSDVADDDDVVDDDNNIGDDEKDRSETEVVSVEDDDDDTEVMVEDTIAADSGTATPVMGSVAVAVAVASLLAPTVFAASVFCFLASLRRPWSTVN